MIRNKTITTKTLVQVLLWVCLVLCSMRRSALVKYPGFSCISLLNILAYAKLMLTLNFEVANLNLGCYVTQGFKVRLLLCLNLLYSPCCPVPMDGAEQDVVSPPWKWVIHMCTVYDPTMLSCSLDYCTRQYS